MFYKTLLVLSQQLNDYLKLSFRLTEDIVYLCSVKDAENALSANKVGISLVNVERETGRGISFNHKNIGDSYSQKTAPSWQLNLYVLISAIFSDKQYEESVKVFSGVLSFLQKNNVLIINESGQSIAIEPVNLSFQELSNLWSICGGTYFPSILCKIRVLSIDEQEITELTTTVKNEKITIK